MVKLLFKMDRENEVIVQGELLQELEVKVYEKKLGRFTEETKTIREITNEKFEVFLDLENIRLLTRVNDEMQSEATLKGAKHTDIFRIVKVFALDDFGNNAEYDFSKKNVYSSELDGLGLNFIVRIY